MTMRHTRGDPAEGPADERASFDDAPLVRTRMSRPAITVTATTPLAEAVRLMALRRIHYLPVVDADGAPIGIVNSDDVLGTRRRQRGPADVVGAVMSAPVISITSTARLADAMRLMADRAIGALPVVDGGRVVGILTQSDVLAAVACRWPT